MEIETLLHKEIESNLELLGETKRDSDEYKQLVEVTAKLIDRAIDMEKIHVDAEEKDKNREQEHELKLKQLSQEYEFKLKQLEQEAEFKQKQLEEEGCARAIDHDLKLKQHDEEHKARVNQFIGKLLEIGVYSGLAVWGTYKTLNFEKEGTVTTMAGKSFIGNLFRRK